MTTVGNYEVIRKIGEGGFGHTYEGHHIRDPDAIAASRIFGSLADSGEPSCSDIRDVDSIFRMGYRTLMLGDDVCQRRGSVMSALNLLDAMAEQYERR